MDWVNEPGLDEIIELRNSGKLDEVNAGFARRRDRYAAPQLEYWNVPLFRSRVTAEGYTDEEVARPAPQSKLTQMYTQAAIEFMQHSSDQPFFVYLPYTMPHTPLFRSDEFADHSLGGRYGDVVEELDWSVGQINAALQELGLADNTLLVFSSDNGPWLSMDTEGGRAGLLRHGKGTTFEGGMRVPTVFSWPGRLRSGVVSELGSALDIFPTVAKLAGADDSTAVDGMDLSAVLFDGAASPRTELAYYRAGQLYAYRVGAWKAHFITEGAYGQGEVRTPHEQPQLYHLLRDPSERFDVAAEHPEVVARIQSAVARHESNLTRKPAEFDKRLAGTAQ